MRKLCKFLGWLLSLMVLAAAALVIYLSVTEYRPEDRALANVQAPEGPQPAGQRVTLLSWNTGYAGLDAAADFFMDGGNMVMPVSQAAVEENMDAIAQGATLVRVGTALFGPRPPMHP